ncbi:peptidase [Vulcanimicrobium alpinum]|uniref:Peptidase n=1 Tax=Vulcanimicrobium alpinum TaxID=3016050 RepID=A0AAN1XT49_UNVUL|nr:S41 family peptidase [Vulcanimicrobium alpinum]BDE04779.1 peptidase [Vulcanimicrobium alpinum]
MNRLVPLALAALLGLATAPVPAATPAAVAMTQGQTQELIESYARLSSDFYKKVDAQAALDGARTSMIEYLKKKHVANPTLPQARAGGDDARTAEALQREVSTAVAAYAPKLEPADSLSGSTQITYAAITGVLSSVKDRYTVFLTPKEYAALNEGLDGTSFGGVGISYSIDDKTKFLHIENVILDGPSDKAGVLPEDAITAIDGKPVPALLEGATTVELQQKRVTQALRGDPGTRVRLTIQRAGKDLEPVTITRDTIHQPSVASKMLPGAVGYVDLSVFGQTTGAELSTALKRLDAQGAKAYVLDLRYNGGGYLNAAVDVASKFISNGPIVSVQSRAGTDTEYDAENTAIAPRPLAVLVNQYTASASEITAGAIQDAGVGTLVGVKTFGKGVVQTIFPMRDGSAVKITTARYFTPKGRDINSVGIEPEIRSELPKELKGIRMGDPKTDPQLMAALTYVNGRIAQTDGAARPAAATAH